MNFLNAQDVAQLLGVSKNKAYEIVKQLNKELEQKGFLTIPHRIPEKYLIERFYG